MKWGTGSAGAPDEMHGPVGLARDSTGAIYVAEHGDVGPVQVGGNFVSKYTLSGNAATRVWRNGNSFNVPYGIAVNEAAKLAGLPVPPGVIRPSRRFSLFDLVRSQLGVRLDGLAPALPALRTLLYVMD